MSETSRALNSKPIFADTKFNRRIDRFLRRGRSAARSEWRLTNAAHNLLKLWRHTSAPAAACISRSAPAVIWVSLPGPRT